MIKFVSLLVTCDRSAGSSIDKTDRHDITEIVLKVALNTIEQTNKNRTNRIDLTRGELSEWLLFNTNSAIFQLYHGENKLIFNEMMLRSAVY